MTMVDTFLGIDLNLTPFQKADDTPMNDDTVRELNKMKSENKKLRELLSVVWDNDNYILQNHVNKLMLHQDSLVCNPNKRKLGECDGCNSSGSAENDHRELLKRSNNGVTRVYRRRDPSDKSMIVEDGYEWRKYGQKVTRDNPAPRAYYKCSFAPTCPVKKKVQRSVDDECLLVAIYVGEHNHDSSEKQQDNETGNTKFNSPVHAGKYDHEMLVEQITNSLRRNSDFIQELANEIFTRILECRSF